jgi:hypothetical protein
VTAGVRVQARLYEGRYAVTWPVTLYTYVWRMKIRAKALFSTIFSGLLVTFGVARVSEAMTMPPLKNQALEKAWYSAHGTERDCETPENYPNRIAKLSDAEIAKAFKRTDCGMRFESGPEGVAVFFSCGYGQVLMAWADSVDGCKFLVSIFQAD